MNEINVDSIQRAQSVKHYINTASAGTHQAMMPDDVTPLLTNPLDTLDKLVNLSASAEYFAGSAIVGSLGYTVINQILFAYRKAHAKPKAPEPTIDIFNGTYADMFEKRADKEMSEDNGHASLPDFDATKFTGVYMQMLFMQRGNPDFSARYPAKMPNEILHEMQTQDRTSDVVEAYRALDAKQIDASPAASAIMAEKNKSAKSIDEYQTRVHKAEMDYVLSVLRDAMPERLSDAAWETVPLFIQYKWTMFVYRQAVKALVQESLARERDSDKFDQLLEMVNELHLELEAAARTTQVKLAFENGRLDERHEIVTKEIESKNTKPVTLIKSAHA